MKRLVNHFTFSSVKWQENLKVLNKVNGNMKGNNWPKKLQMKTYKQLFIQCVHHTVYVWYILFLSRKFWQTELFWLADQHMKFCFLFNIIILERLNFVHIRYVSIENSIYWIKLFTEVQMNWPVSQWIIALPI